MNLYTVRPLNWKALGHPNGPIPFAQGMAGTYYYLIRYGGQLTALRETNGGRSYIFMKNPTPEGLKQLCQDDYEQEVAAKYLSPVTLPKTPKKGQILGQA